MQSSPPSKDNRIKQNPFWNNRNSQGAGQFVFPKQRFLLGLQRIIVHGAAGNRNFYKPSHILNNCGPLNTIHPQSILGAPPNPVPPALFYLLISTHSLLSNFSPMESFTEDDEALIQRFIGLCTSDRVGPIVKLPKQATTSTN